MTDEQMKRRRESPVVIKVGGSLLDWPELPRRLDSLLGLVVPDCRRFALVAGGGAAADVIRSMDRIHGLGEEQAHRLAIRAMDLTAALLASLLPGSLVVSGGDELDAAWRESRVPILAPGRFLETLDAQGVDPLPASWDVTSDSIAARLARQIGAVRLILLKSVGSGGISTLEQAARAGLVDSFFPVATAALSCVEIVCLRDAALVFHRLRQAASQSSRASLLTPKGDREDNPLSG
jgi:aspartokinase-like uncharacterized kinase